MLGTRLVNVLGDRGHEGVLQKLMDLPVIRFDGEAVDAEELARGVEEYTKVFRREIGGCSETAEIKAA